ncbi:hypothetical protein [Niallia sp. Krafla_26]|uniref:hypothetical protein n=1 Tax=Niallia sp. Krafla_26 TaxID=3064703 RepID=UPI003D17297A
MARLPEGKQRISVGCYYEMSPGKNFTINMSFIIRWYAWPFLMWKFIRKEQDVKWYQYPTLVLIIINYTLKKWLKINE